MQIVNQLAEIILLRRKPQDIAYHPVFLAITIAVLFAVTWLTYAANPLYSQPLAYALVSVGLMLLVWYLILLVADKIQRFIQSATAIVTLTIVQTVSLSTLLNITVSTMVALLIIAFNIWLIFVFLTVFSAALDRSKLFCVLILFTLNLIPSIITSSVFPELPKENESVIEQFQQRLEAS